jgi:hypothetical protein
VADDDLEYLTWHWGSAYKISYRLGQYRAERRDDQTTLQADTAEALLLPMREDYRVKPVPR